MNKFIVKKYLCFCRDLTLVTRVIGFIGIAISILLITVLSKDMFVKNFDVSRKIALALGLDFRHIHSSTNTTPHADPEGVVISSIMVLYAILFFLTNALLSFAAIIRNPLFALPWLIGEFIGCASKSAGLIYHLITEVNNLSIIFVMGSIIYIVVMIWWWLVVYVAQKSWDADIKTIQLIELAPTNNNETRDDINISIPYTPNPCYAMI